jgi:hypothetical protein
MATSSLTQPTSASTGNIPYVGTTANDNTGSPLRDAFSRINSRLIEIYGSQDGSNVVQTPFVDGDNIKNDTIDSKHYAAGSIDEEHLNITNSPSANQVLQWDGGTGFTWVNQYDGDITSVVAGLGLTGGATEDDATLNVGAGTGITVNANDVQISDNGVDHQQLSASYTELSALGTGSSFALNFDSACTFTATMDANATFTLSNAQQGQVIDLILSGNFTVTFAETGSTFNKVGSTSYDGSTTNIIQIICTDDSSGSKIYHYAVGTYASSITA